MNKVFKGILIAVAAIYTAASAPFLVNGIINAASFNPLKDSSASDVVEAMIGAMYSDVVYSSVSFVKEKTLNFGEYTVCCDYLMHKKAEGDDTVLDLKPTSAKYKNNKFGSEYDMPVPSVSRGVIDKESLENKASSSGMQSDEYYYARFKVNGDYTRNEMPASYARELFSLEDGRKVVEWVGYSCEKFDFLIGERPNETQSLYLVLKSISEENEKFIKSFYAFEALKNVDFSEMADELADNPNTACVVMYAKGEELRYFENDERLSLADFY